MPAIDSVWVSTPNKKDNLTNGWTSKTLFNYQFPESDVTVNDSTEVFANIINTYGINYKGTNILPAYYFLADNSEDSRTFKITMLFDKQLDNQNVSFALGLYDINNSTAEVVGPLAMGGTKNAGGVTLAKLEYYCCVYYNNDTGELIMSIVGAIIYTPDTPGTANTLIQPYKGYAVLPNGMAPSYSLYIENQCEAGIFPHSLVVEELG